MSMPWSRAKARHGVASKSPGTSNSQGEGDRSLEHWRAEHERFFTEHATTGFDPQMLLVLERFRVVYAGD